MGRPALREDFSMSQIRKEKGRAEIIQSSTTWIGVSGKDQGFKKYLEKEGTLIASGLLLVPKMEYFIIAL